MYSHYIILCFYLESFLLLVVANEEETRQFFNDALRCILEIQRGAPDGFSQDRLYIELEDYARTLSAFLSVPSFVNEPSNIHCIRSLRGLYECFRCLLREYQPLQQTEHLPGSTHNNDKEPWSSPVQNNCRSDHSLPVSGNELGKGGIMPWHKPPYIIQAPTVSSPSTFTLHDNIK